MDDFKGSLDKSVHYTEDQFATLRTGRATPAMVEQLKVNVYDSEMKMFEVAAISCPEPRQLIISPWDPSITQSIEKAIQQSPLGLSPAVDGNVIRLNIPPLTEETRRDILKVLGQMLEAGKVSLRKVREEYLKKLKKQKEDGEISEDILRREEKTVDEEIKKRSSILEEAARKKESEILTI